MPPFLREQAPGCHWGASVHAASGDDPLVQRHLPFTQRAQLEADQVSLRQLFAEAVRVGGGAEWLCSALGREETYSKKISGAINNERDRKVQLEWLAPLLEDPAVAEMLLGWLSERCGFAPPVRKRALTKEEVSASVAEVVGDMDGITKDAIRREVARRRGVRVDDVKL